MTSVKKRLISLVLAFCFLAVLSVSVFALSPVRCTGGDAGSWGEYHYYGGFLGIGQKKHWHTYDSHTVDRVWSGHIYADTGHTPYDCGLNDYNFSPGCIGTIVGEG